MQGQKERAYLNFCIIHHYIDITIMMKRRETTRETETIIESALYRSSIENFKNEHS